MSPKPLDTARPERGRSGPPPLMTRQTPCISTFPPVRPQARVISGPPACLQAPGVRAAVQSSGQWYAGKPGLQVCSLMQVCRTPSKDLQFRPDLEVRPDLAPGLYTGRMPRSPQDTFQMGSSSQSAAAASAALLLSTCKDINKQYQRNSDLFSVS